MNDNTGKKNDAGFKSFALIRVLVAVVLIIAVVWGLTYGLNYVETIMPRPQSDETASSSTSSNMDQALLDTGSVPELNGAGEQETSILPGKDVSPSEDSDHGLPETDTPALTADKEAVEAHRQDDVVKPAVPTTPESSTEMKEPAKPAGETGLPAETHAPSPPPHTAAPETVSHPLRPGVTFVRAAIEPLAYELKHRWWGWRPNDIINLTDNVNHYQLGVLEVTRRTAVQLAERISRTGSTDAFNPHLENAMNWVMVSPDKYWFPSPESKYRDSLDELAIYKNQLIENQASFYTRSDNIIPLLAAFEDLLGSCDENLVKATEKDGSKVGFFSTDNYFYYAKGIASAMVIILEAVNHDFTDVLEKRNGAELLHHAIESCRRAAELDPWIITDADLDGILANHRANMAAPISHAKFYLGQLIKTLST